MIKWSLKYLKIILFSMWLVYTKIWFTYTFYTNGIDLVSQKWLKMTFCVWLDMKEKQRNGIWAVFEICSVYVLVYGFFWYADGIHIYWNLWSERYKIRYKTRHDRFWLVYNWYMVSWYMYNDLFLLCYLNPHVEKYHQREKCWHILLMTINFAVQNLHIYKK